MVNRAEKFLALFSIPVVYTLRKLGQKSFSCVLRKRDENNNKKEKQQGRTKTESMFKLCIKMC